MKTRIIAAVAAIAILLSFAVSSMANEHPPQVKLAVSAVREFAEGKTYTVTWTSDDVETVTVTARGYLISRPGAPIGTFEEPIAVNVPASQGKATWVVPYLDAVRFSIDIRGYDRNEKEVAKNSLEYGFRPAVLRTRTANGIYVDLRNPKRQRLYVLRGNRVTHAYLTSGSRTTAFLTKAHDSSKPHDHVGVFRVTQKVPMYWSNEFSVWMTHAMRFWKGHFIHGTYPSEYHLLGTPASSGCIRLDRTNAEELYNMTSIGARVEIFGNVQ